MPDASDLIAMSNNPDNPPSAQPSTAPTATPAPAANAAPATPAPAPNAAPQQAQPQQHDFFRQVLGALAGGSNRPVIGRDGNPVTDANGNVVTAPATKKSLGMSIVAGALSSMMAGFQYLPTTDENGRVTSHLNEAAQAGAQAAQPFTAKAQQTAAQNMSDAQRTRAYQTFKQNLHMHTAAQAAANLDNETRQKMVDTYKPIWDYVQNDPQLSGTVIAQNLDEAGVAKQMATDAAHGTKDMAIPMGMRPEIGADGKPTGRQEQLWALLPNNGSVTLTPELAATYGYPASLAGQSVYIGSLMTRAGQATDTNHATQVIAHFANDLKQNVSLGDIQKTNAQFRNPAFVSALGGAAGMPLDKALDYIKKFPNGGASFAAEIMHQFNLTPAQLEKMTLDRESAKKEADQRAKDADNPDKQPADVAKISAIPRTLKSDYPMLTPQQRDSLSQRIPDKMTNGEYDKLLARADALQQTNIKAAQVQATRDQNAVAKGEKPVIGQDANGNPVFTSSGNAPKSGLKETREVGQAEAEKVTNARSLMGIMSDSDPDDLGVIQLADKLDRDGKLGVLATRVQDWLNRKGSLLGFDAGDPDMQRLMTKIGLAQTALMQVHVGSRGGAFMLEHFADLANAKAMSAPAFKAALGTEYKYVTRKAMLPSQKSAPASKNAAPAPKVDWNQLPDAK